jgi:hypothetical protein
MVAGTLAGCAADNTGPSQIGAGGPPVLPASDASASGNGGGIVHAADAAQASPTVDASVVIPNLEKCGEVTQMAENKLQAVDIIIGVDTTSSMVEEIGFTEQNMNAFSQQIASAGIDARVIVISGLKDGMPPFLVNVDGVCIGAPLGSGSCPADTKAPGYVHIAQHLANWDMLQFYVDLYPMYKQHLRETSLKSFVSISDGNVGGNISNFIYPITVDTADKFIAAVQAFQPGTNMWKDWRYSAIYSFTACGLGNDVGAVHDELVTKTDGVRGDLCLQNFKPVFDDLGRKVVETVALACEWQIPPAPMGKSFDAAKTNVKVTLDGKAETLGNVRSGADCGTREGWHYDDGSAPRRVMACPATCGRIQAAQRAQVELLFGCDTVMLF